MACSHLTTSDRHRDTPSSTSMWWLLCVFWLWPTVAPAQSLTAVSSGTDLWIAQSSADGHTSILHRGPRDTPDQLRPVIALPPPAPVGFAAGQDRLWVIVAIKNRNVESHLAVSSVRVLPDAARRPTQHFGKSVVETPLPLKVALRGCAAGRRRLWMLVGTEDPNVLNRIDQLQPPLEDDTRDEPESAQRSRSEFDVEPTDDGQIDAPAAGDASANHVASPVKFEGPQDRLVRIHGNRWGKVAMPDRWPHGSRCWLVVDDQTPRLIALVSDTEGSHLEVYRPANDGWSSTNFPVQITEVLQPILVESQLLVGWQSLQSSGVEVTVELMRQGTELGQLVIESASHPWALVPVDQHAVLVAADRNGGLFWTRMDLRGNVVRPEPMRIQAPAFWMQDADLVLWTSTLLIATLSMLAYWRRDPQANKLGLPQQVILSDFGRRIGAGVVDLAPCVVVMLLICRIAVGELYYKSPGRTGQWSDMVPGALVIALFVGHCLLTEVFTAKTLGKALFGLRVTDLRGRPPNVGQILVRNLMKTFDLIAPPLLFLPLVGPYRQRLGDMVGRTVIVMSSSSHASRGSGPTAQDDGKQDTDDGDT